MTDDTRAPRPRALFTRPDAGWIYLWLSDEGVILSGDRITWFRGSTRVEQALTDIRRVNLRLTPARGGGDTGMMLIGFADGTFVAIYGCDARSRHVPERARDYRDMVADVHRRLSAEARGRVEFMTGYTGSGGVVAGVALGLMVAALVVMLIWLAPSLGRMGPITVFLTLVAMPLSLVPFWRLVRANRAAPYHPDRIPGEMLP